MANQPDPNMQATSFTLPKALLDAVRTRAKVEMTNPSDIIRRALMNYLPDNVREEVIAKIRCLEAAIKAQDRYAGTDQIREKNGAVISSSVAAVLKESSSAAFSELANANRGSQPSHLARVPNAGTCEPKRGIHARPDVLPKIPKPAPSGLKP